MMKDREFLPYESVNMYPDMIIDTSDKEEINDCINSKEVEVRRLVALNKHLDDDEINQLLNDPDDRVVEHTKLNKHYQNNVEKLNNPYKTQKKESERKNEYER